MASLRLLGALEHMGRLLAARCPEAWSPGTIWRRWCLPHASEPGAGEEVGAQVLALQGEGIVDPGVWPLWQAGWESRTWPLGPRGLSARLFAKPIQISAFLIFCKINLSLV